MKIRLTYYTIDVAAFSEATPMPVNRLEKGACKPATTLHGVTSFHPDCVVENEVTAVA